MELGLATAESSPPGVGLSGSGVAQVCTGDDGKLYFADSADTIPKQGTLILIAYYDNSMRQSIPINLSGSPNEVTVTWTNGVPHPKETTGAIPDIAMILGPSDKNGYIRWENVKPGTYELYGGKGGETQKYEIKMPDEKAMADLTLKWNPD